MALERRAGPERHHRDAMLIAELQQLRRFLGPLDERDRFGHRAGLVILAMAVLLSQRGVVAPADRRGSYGQSR